MVPHSRAAVMLVGRKRRRRRMGSREGGVPCRAVLCCTLSVYVHCKVVLGVAADRVVDWQATFQLKPFFCKGRRPRC
jgi:hypothetical protein